MNPFYFGDKSRQLYGVLHPAEGASFRDEAVVLCYPYGQEYERAHRAFKILANNLSNLGYEVLRFDYAGTGDSWGDSDDISMAEWQADIRQAVAEAKDTAGVDRVSLIGLRLGATLALMAADRIEGLHRVVCWDPVVDGESFFREAESFLDEHSARILKNTDSKETVFFMGYPLQPAFRKELAGLDLSQYSPGSAECVVITSREDSGSRQAVELLAQQGNNIRYEEALCESDWNTVNLNGGILIPQRIISSITELFN